VGYKSDKQRETTKDRLQLLFCTTMCSLQGRQKSQINSYRLLCVFMEVYAISHPLHSTQHTPHLKNTTALIPKISNVVESIFQLNPGFLYGFKVWVNIQERESDRRSVNDNDAFTSKLQKTATSIVVCPKLSTLK